MNSVKRTDKESLSEYMFGIYIYMFIYQPMDYMILYASYKYSLCYDSYE